MFGSSFRGQELDGKEEKDKKKQEKEFKLYLYGKIHRFKTCWYLIEMLRLAAWKPDHKV